MRTNELIFLTLRGVFRVQYVIYKYLLNKHICLKTYVIIQYSTQNGLVDIWEEK